MALFTITFIIEKLTKYLLNDILFIEGIILIISGFLFSGEENKMGISFQSMGQINFQYISNFNLEILN